jgi:hypothetical protein
MSKLLARLTENVLDFVRHEHSLLERSREFYTRAACLESTYARYEKPAYLRRRTRVGRAVDPAAGRSLPTAQPIRADAI